MKHPHYHQNGCPTHHRGTDYVDQLGFHIEITKADPSNFDAVHLQSMCRKLQKMVTNLEHYIEEKDKSAQVADRFTEHIMEQNRELSVTMEDMHKDMANYVAQIEKEFTNYQTCNAIREFKFEALAKVISSLINDVKGSRDLSKEKTYAFLRLVSELYTTSVTAENLERELMRMRDAKREWSVIKRGAMKCFRRHLERICKMHRVEDELVENSMCSLSDVLGQAEGCMFDGDGTLTELLDSVKLYADLLKEACGIEKNDGEEDGHQGRQEKDNTNPANLKWVASCRRDIAKNYSATVNMIGKTWRNSVILYGSDTKVDDPADDPEQRAPAAPPNFQCPIDEGSATDSKKRPHGAKRIREFVDSGKEDGKMGNTPDSCENSNELEVETSPAFLHDQIATGNGSAQYMEKQDPENRRPRDQGRQISESKSADTENNEKKVQDLVDVEIRQDSEDVDCVPESPREQETKSYPKHEVSHDPFQVDDSCSSLSVDSLDSFCELKQLISLEDVSNVEMGAYELEGMLDEDKKAKRRTCDSTGKTSPQRQRNSEIISSRGKDLGLREQMPNVKNDWGVERSTSATVTEVGLSVARLDKVKMEAATPDLEAKNSSTNLELEGKQSNCEDILADSAANKGGNLSKEKGGTDTPNDKVQGDHPAMQLLNTRSGPSCEVSATQNRQVNETPFVSELIHEGPSVYSKGSAEGLTNQSDRQPRIVYSVEVLGREKSPKVNHEESEEGMLSDKDSFLIPCKLPGMLFPPEHAESKIQGMMLDLERGAGARQSLSEETQLNRTFTVSDSLYGIAERPIIQNEAVVLHTVDSNTQINLNTYGQQKSPLANEIQVVVSNDSNALQSKLQNARSSITLVSQLDTPTDFFGDLIEASTPDEYPIDTSVGIAGPHVTRGTISIEDSTSGNEERVCSKPGNEPGVSNDGKELLQDANSISLASSVDPLVREYVSDTSESSVVHVCTQNCQMHPNSESTNRSILIGSRTGVVNHVTSTPKNSPESKSDLTFVVEKDPRQEVKLKNIHKPKLKGTEEGDQEMVTGRKGVAMAPVIKGRSSTSPCQSYPKTMMPTPPPNASTPKRVTRRYTNIKESTKVLPQLSKTPRPPSTGKSNVTGKNSAGESNRFGNGRAGRRLKFGEQGDDVGPSSKSTEKVMPLNRRIDDAHIAQDILKRSDGAGQANKVDTEKRKCISAKIEKDATKQAEQKCDKSEETKENTTSEEMKCKSNHLDLKEERRMVKSLRGMSKKGGNAKGSDKKTCKTKKVIETNSEVHDPHKQAGRKATGSPDENTTDICKSREEDMNTHANGMNGEVQRQKGVVPEKTNVDRIGLVKKRTWSTLKRKAEKLIKGGFKTGDGLQNRDNAKSSHRQDTEKMDTVTVETRNGRDERADKKHSVKKTIQKQAQAEMRQTSSTGNKWESRTPEMIERKSGNDKTSQFRRHNKPLSLSDLHKLSEVHTPKKTNKQDTQYGEAEMKQNVCERKTDALEKPYLERKNSEGSVKECKTGDFKEKVLIGMSKTSKYEMQTAEMKESAREGGDDQTKRKLERKTDEKQVIENGHENVHAEGKANVECYPESHSDEHKRFAEFARKKATISSIDDKAYSKVECNTALQQAELTDSTIPRKATPTVTDLLGSKAEMSHSESQSLKASNCKYYPKWSENFGDAQGRSLIGVKNLSCRAGNDDLAEEGLYHQSGDTSSRSTCSLGMADISLHVDELLASKTSPTGYIQEDGKFKFCSSGQLFKTATVSLPRIIQRKLADGTEARTNTPTTVRDLTQEKTSRIRDRKKRTKISLPAVKSDARADSVKTPSPRIPILKYMKSSLPRLPKISDSRSVKDVK